MRKGILALPTMYALMPYPVTQAFLPRQCDFLRLRVKGCRQLQNSLFLHPKQKELEQFRCPDAMGIGVTPATTLRE
jgi:hypothetical protein